MQQDQSITGWFLALRDGDDSAADRLWRRYFNRIMSVARGRLPPDTAYDEEDLALSVFHAVCKAAQEGRCPDLSNREELWALMLVIARRKVTSRVRHVSRKRRAGDGQRPQRTTIDPDELAAGNSSGALSVTLEEECERLLKLLNDPKLESIALMKLDGYTSAEIGRQVGVAEATVKRKLAVIRKRWEAEFEEEA